MTDPRVSLRTVDLDSCHREPIHVPGSVQPHGVLLAVDFSGRLTHVSRNAPLILPPLPPLGQAQPTTADWSSSALRAATDGMLEDARSAGEVPPLAIEAGIGDAHFDVVLHARAGRVLIEFEPRDVQAQELASFAMLAHRSMARLKGRRDIDSILVEATTAVRSLTGFDRVMAYRFHADDSGEIVAEARIDLLDPYLGRRFPAADIPVQARHLYLVNTLRLIADVSDAQVPLDAFDPGEAALDLSHSILRSVSPIHIEYLKNIGVAASMSISIVVGGRLWGLIACHHRSAHRVPYAVRMACDVLAHVVSTSVQLLLEKAAGARRAAAAELRSALVDLVVRGPGAADGALSPATVGSAMAVAIASDRMIFAQGADLHHAGIAAEAATALLQWLEPQSGDMIALHGLSTLPDALRQSLWPLGGLMALRHDRLNRGWIVLLRLEQETAITWSGPPDKVSRVGPLGARLTPDGSLAEWRQDVRGSCAPWDALDLALAREILDEVGRATAFRAAEMDQARAHLMTVLGHDLRGPLQAIGMAALLIERGRDQAHFARRISVTSGRMGRLIGQMLDMSRLQGGLGLGLSLQRVDLVALVLAASDEMQLAHPNGGLELDLPERLEADLDADRMAQVLANLLGNARQHGAPGEHVAVRLAAVGDRLMLTVSNTAPAIDDTLIAGLFDPLKRASTFNLRNPGGLGIGLYIAKEVVAGHGGTLRYSHDGTRVVFTIDLPLSR